MNSVLRRRESNGSTKNNALLVGLLMSLVTSQSQADITDMLQACNVIPPTTGSNGYLFLLDDSTSMDSTSDVGIAGLTRWEALEQVFEQLLNDLPDSAQVGLVIMGQAAGGGYIAHPMAPLGQTLPVTDTTDPLYPTELSPGSTATTVREELIRIVQRNELSSGTTTQGLLEETIRYLRGDAVDYGADRLPPVKPAGYTQWLADDPDPYGTESADDDFLSHPRSFTLNAGASIDPPNCAMVISNTCEAEIINGGATYISPFDRLGPVDTEIHVVLMFDGGPAGPNDQAKIEALIGGDSCAAEGGAYHNSGWWRDDRCLRSLASYMGDLPDFRPTLAGNQTVKISTIGIGANDPEDIALVNDLVTEGGKPYFVASKADLELAYYDSTGGGATTTPTWATGQINFAGVGKAVSFENQMVHDAGLYFPVFEARVGPAWPGNLKRYELKGDPDDATVPVIVRGVSGKPAIDETIGRFTEDVRSHWSSAVDGNAAGEGGAASKLDPPNRKLYSNLDSGSALHASNNRITKANLSPSDFGIGLTDAQKDKLVDWMSGNGDTAQYMGHPLMSVPTVVSYGALGSATPNQVAFVGTNQGYLHAIDANASDGNELWAFMPKKLLPNIFKQSVGSPADQTPYGMDGSPMVWSQNGGDRKIIGDAGDTLLLVTGMRRGGDSYYFLNITDPEKPELHWEITGGDTGFERLGETWATPVAARVILSGDTSLTDVLIFSGGYDSATQDPLTAHKTTADTVGHDIFMVDPLTKTLVWSASTANATAGYIPNKADMKHSIPGSVAVIDVNGDGLTDQFYAADVGGNVWRFDVNHKPGSNSKLVSGGRIGKFGGDGPSGHRQFFTKPDLAMTIRGHKAVVTVALGSGSMPSPLRADVTDRFYVLIQEIDKPTSYTTLSHSSLTNRTTLSGTTNSAGWYMDFPPGPGEKLLTPSITLANTAIFTTYLPPPAGVTDCDGETTARLWAISLLDGKAVPGIFSGTGAVGSRGELMTHFAGMLPKMDLVISDNGPVLLAGPRRLFLDKDFGLKEHTWQRQIWSRE